MTFERLGTKVWWTEATGIDGWLTFCPSYNPEPASEDPRHRWHRSMTHACDNCVFVSMELVWDLGWQPEPEWQRMALARYGLVDLYNSLSGELN